ncbi:MAG: YebC/PmpR family DNA-binding transcriptional regulator [Kiritimatiellia bacterium]
MHSAHAVDYTDDLGRLFDFGDLLAEVVDFFFPVGSIAPVGGEAVEAAVVIERRADDEEAVLEALLNADVDVIDIENEDGHITVFAPDNEYGQARQAICEVFGDDEGEVEFEADVIQFLPQATVSLQGEDVDVFEKLIDMLTDLDDVQNVYHNVA